MNTEDLLLAVGFNQLAVRGVITPKEVAAEMNAILHIAITSETYKKNSTAEELKALMARIIGFRWPEHRAYAYTFIGRFFYETFQRHAEAEALKILEEKARITIRMTRETFLEPHSFLQPIKEGRVQGLTAYVLIQDALEKSVNFEIRAAVHDQYYISFGDLRFRYNGKGWRCADTYLFFVGNEVIVELS